MVYENYNTLRLHYPYQIQYEISVKATADFKNLKTIKSYALKNKVTPAYIYKLIKKGKMKAFLIDGVQFIDENTYPTINNR